MAWPTSSTRGGLTAILACCWLLCGGCNLEGAGDPPPRGRIFLPTGVAVSADGRFLFVLNSNFNRRYSSGTVQSFNIDKLQNCDGDAADLNCQIDPEGEALVDEVRVGSIGRTLVASPNGNRLYLPTHADGALTYVEVDGEGKLSCGGGTRCSDLYRRGVDGDSAIGFRFPADPVAVWPVPLSTLTCGSGECPDTGEAVVVAHRGGEVSLFVDAPDDDGVLRPYLTHVFYGALSGLTGLTQDPSSGMFLLTSAANDAGSKVLSRLGVYVEADPLQSFLYPASFVPLRGVASGRNTWAVQARDGAAGEGSLLVVSQEPDALLQVDFNSATGQASVARAIEVGPGASRLVQGQLSDGEMTMSVAVISCYADRRMYVVETSRGEVVAILNGFNGPFEAALDQVHNRLYVVDFRASVLRIADLEPVLSREPARIVGTLGTPQPLEELQ